MRNEFSESAVDRPILTSALVSAVAWLVVVVLALAGVMMLAVHGNTGALLLVCALVVAAPAAAISQHRNAR